MTTPVIPGQRITDAADRQLTHLNTVFTYAWLRTGTRSEAHLLTKQTFHRVTATRLVNRALLLGIARALTSEYLRTEQFELAVGPEDLPERPDLARLLGLLKRLNPPAAREILALRVILGLSGAETAQVTGRRLHNVYVAQNRALNALAQLDEVTA